MSWSTPNSLDVVTGVAAEGATAAAAVPALVVVMVALLAAAVDHIHWLAYGRASPPRVLQTCP